MTDSARSRRRRSPSRQAAPDPAAGRRPVTAWLPSTLSPAAAAVQQVIDSVMADPTRAIDGRPASTGTPAGPADDSADGRPRPEDRNRGRYFHALAERPPSWCLVPTSGTLPPPIFFDIEDYDIDVFFDIEYSNLDIDVTVFDIVVTKNTSISTKRR